MNRLLVTLLAALDAAIAVAVGLVVVAAPATLLWAFGFGGTADWSALWPAVVRVWQFGHFVPVEITLSEQYLTATGIPADGARFALSLAPTALAAFTAIFAARSGARAAKAGAWPLGVAGGAVVVVAAASAFALTAHLDVAAVDTVVAVAGPALVYVVPALGGALVGAWRHGDDGWVDAARAALARHSDWVHVPAAAARGAAAALVGVVGFAAVCLAGVLLARGGAIVGLYQSAHLDLLGVVVFSLAQLAFLPTLVVWAAAYVAGPGFALGAGTTVSPAGTSLGVVPGIPVLGAVPEGASTWLLLLALGVIGAGALAGGIARARLAGGSAGDEPMAPRLAVLGLLVATSAAAAALLAALASGSIGPGRMATVGPAAGPFALAVAVEIGIGAGILLLAPRLEPAPEDRAPARHRTPAVAPWHDHATGLAAEPARAAEDTAPVTPWPEADPDATGPIELWPEADPDATAPVTPLEADAPAEPGGATVPPPAGTAADEAAPDTAETMPLDEFLPPRHDTEGGTRPPLD
ncbi:cell division protein PerM [Microbacterium sp. MC2]